jgi:RimJ/RimL family protein N-acetyltransferase
LGEENYNRKNEPSFNHRYQIRKITNELYENEEITNIVFIRAKILEFWTTPKDFFEKGIGYCIVQNNEIISLCFLGFVERNIHCITIKTLQSHQGQKLAQKVTHAFVKNCFEKEFTPYWDCTETSFPSNAVAKRVGFTKHFNYTGYAFRF